MSASPAAADLCYLDATALAALIRSREVSPVEVVRALKERAAELNPQLNAIVAWAPAAEAQALAAERALAPGGAAAGGGANALGPLHGVPFTVKDTLDVGGLEVTRGSLLFKGTVAPRDATAVARLRAAGGIVLAKTNTPEFALWWETGNRVYGTTNNPWALERTPGGSSGGEAAALAAGLTPLGLAGDVGGSIRLPAHHCGVFGFKPSHGRVPLTGHFPAALTRFMHVGPMARSARDCALAFALTAGADGEDFHALPVAAPDVAAALAGSPLPALRVALLPDTGFGPVDESIAAAVREAGAALAALGCAVEEVEAPWLAATDWNTLTMLLYGSEGRPYFQALTAGREEELHYILARRLGAPAAPLDDYVAAEAAVEHLRADATRFFAAYDLLVCPTTPVAAPHHEEPLLRVAGQEVHSRGIMRATLPWDLTGQPALAAPWGFDGDGLPLGVQLVGARLADATVLHAGAALDAVRPAREVRPDL